MYISLGCFIEIRLPYIHLFTYINIRRIDHESTLWNILFLSHKSIFYGNKSVFNASGNSRSLFLPLAFAVSFFLFLYPCTLSLSLHQSGYLLFSVVFFHSIFFSPCLGRFLFFSVIFRPFLSLSLSQGGINPFYSYFSCSQSHTHTPIARYAMRFVWNDREIMRVESSRCTVFQMHADILFWANKSSATDAAYGAHNKRCVLCLRHLLNCTRVSQRVAAQTWRRGPFECSQIATCARVHTYDWQWVVALVVCAFPLPERLQRCYCITM